MGMPTAVMLLNTSLQLPIFVNFILPFFAPDKFSYEPDLTWLVQQKLNIAVDLTWPVQQKLNTAVWINNLNFDMDPCTDDRFCSFAASYFDIL